MKLKELRTRLGISQIEAARRIGCALLTYQLWEREVSGPNEKNHAKLREVFGEEVDG